MQSEQPKQNEQELPVETAKEEINLEEILAALDPESLLMEPRETYDCCIIGITNDKRAIYSANKVVEIIHKDMVQFYKENPDQLFETDGEEEDLLMMSIEHYYYNVEGAYFEKGPHFTDLDYENL